MQIPKVYILLFMAISTGCAPSEELRQHQLAPNKPLNTTEATQPMPAHVEQAFSYLEQKKKKLNLTNPRAQLILVNETIDRFGKKHLKFQQIHKQVPVWGHEIIIHLDETNTPYSINGDILSPLNIASTTPAITPHDAVNSVIQAAKWGLQGWRATNDTLYILNQNSRDYLTYRLIVRKGLLRNFVFVNAENGEIIHSISGTYH